MPPCPFPPICSLYWTEEEHPIYGMLSVYSLGPTCHFEIMFNSTVILISWNGHRILQYMCWSLNLLPLLYNMIPILMPETRISVLIFGPAGLVCFCPIVYHNQIVFQESCKSPTVHCTSHAMIYG